jgi:hypothetical protein
VSDIGGAPSARLLLARLDMQIGEQHLVLQRKELRLRELDEEEARVRVDIEEFMVRKAETEAERATITEKGTTEAMRLDVKARELALLVKGKEIRLLELDDEREQIATDKVAAEAHIAKLGAEVAQQTARLKEST